MKYARWNLDRSVPRRTLLRRLVTLFGGCGILMGLIFSAPIGHPPALSQCDGKGVSFDAPILIHSVLSWRSFLPRRKGFGLYRERWVVSLREEAVLRVVEGQAAFALADAMRRDCSRRLQKL